MLACDGSVHGAVATARSNTAPDRAQRSRFGDVDRWYPYSPRFAARTVSRINSTTLGAPSRATPRRPNARRSATAGRVAAPHAPSTSSMAATAAATCRIDLVNQAVRLAAARAMTDAMPTLSTSFAIGCSGIPGDVATAYTPGNANSSVTFSKSNRERVSHAKPATSTPRSPEATAATMGAVQRTSGLYQVAG